MNTNVTSTSDTIKVTAGDDVTLTLAGVNISSDSASALEIDATGAVTLILSGSNTLTSSADNCAGLQKTSTTNTLTITSADGATTGSLTANGGKYGAGIGGGKSGAGSNITIEGGTITATGGESGAGIGGGGGGGSGDVSITGGTVDATGGEYGAGIGGAEYGGSTVTISGGTVNAIGGERGAGIGSGYQTYDSNTITISGGYITATVVTAASPLGYGSDPQTSSSTLTVTITGGCFADGTVGASDRGNVYGCGVLDGYGVYASGVSDYSYAVNAAVFAVSDDTGSIYTGYTYKENVLTITEGGTYTIKQTDASTATTHTIKVTAGDDVTLTLAGVNISSISKSPLEIDAAGDVTIILSGTNTLDASSSGSYAGLQKTSTGNTLTITCETDDTTDRLTATGGTEAAGIGGGNGGDGSNITISGGTVEATSYAEGMGAGIGGGMNGSGSNITIEGGIVNATSGTSVSGSGAGIGGGNGGSGTVTITGGYITASSTNGDCIGSGGSGGDAASVTITGGCFGSGTVGASGTGEVYGCAVADGYGVYASGDANYPYAVNAAVFAVSGDTGGIHIKITSSPSPRAAHIRLRRRPLTRPPTSSRSRRATMSPSPSTA